MAAGCSSGTSPSGSTSSQTPSSSPSETQSTIQPPTPQQPATPPASSAQGGSFDQSTCLDIAFTKDGLMLASDPAKARSAADALEKYGPPDPVKVAIEHFVTTVGAQPNDSGLDTNKDLIVGWIKQICPTVNP
jgi:hypothetical protein